MNIYNENCLQTMSLMQDNAVRLVVTSPPYNFDRGSGMGNKYSNGVKDNIQNYFEWSVAIIDELLRVTSGVVCYNIQWLSGNKIDLFRLMAHYGEHIRELLVWDKINGQPAMNPKVFNSQFEFVLVLCKEKGSRKIENTMFERGTQSNVLRISTTTKLDIISKGLVHKATFPILLAEKLICLFSCEGDLVYDSFAGIGTTAVASIKLSRDFVGRSL